MRCTIVHHMSSTMTAVPEQIEKLIYLIRGQKVMLDDDLATLYEVSMKRLNEQVHRNIERFPADFMFQISEAELDSLHSLRSQFATSKQEGRGGRRYLPYAFTEHGILMLSSVLRSRRAIQVNIAIMRTFVEMRKMLLSYAELASRIGKLEESYDEQFRIVFDALRQLMAPPSSTENEQKIGFRLD